MSSSRAEIVSIQPLRAIAALTVVFYHVYIIGRAPGNFGTEYWAAVAKPGMLGVNLFFVLSGFIIFRAHFKDIGNPAAIVRYANRRFTRIYPLYWILTGAYVIAAMLGLGDPDYTTDIGNVLSSILLFEFTDKVTAPLQVAWTLFYEMKFYIVFGLMIINVRLGVAALFIHLCYIVVAQISGWQDIFHFSSMWFLHFYIGIGTYFLSLRLTAKWGAPLLLVGFALVAWYISEFNYDMSALKANESRLLVLAPAFGAILLGTVLLEQPIRTHCPRWLRLLGDASYSIYLVHSAAISVLFIISRKLGISQTVPPYALFLAIFAISTLAGVVVYFVLEKPLLSLIRTRRVERSASVVAGVK